MQCNLLRIDNDMNLCTYVVQSTALDGCLQSNAKACAIREWDKEFYGADAAPAKNKNKMYSEKDGRESRRQEDIPTDEEKKDLRSRDFRGFVSFLEGPALSWRI